MNSAMYQAAVCAVTRDGWGRLNDFIEKVLRFIPRCRVDLEDFYKGMDLEAFPDGIAAPGDLEELDLRCWWGEYDNLLEFYGYELDQGDEEEEADDNDEDGEEDECENHEASTASDKSFDGGSRKTKPATTRLMIARSFRPGCRC
ncbi:hypothetical protein E8E11_007623 [Didymella keratinophila]|nr:hypothetical protein E8E11_007623 [Didymella keratinophila]